MRVSTKDLVRVNSTGAVKVMVKDSTEKFILDLITDEGFRADHYSEAVDGRSCTMSFFFQNTVESRNDMQAMLSLIARGGAHNIDQYSKLGKFDLVVIKV